MKTIKLQSDGKNVKKYQLIPYNKRIITEFVDDLIHKSEKGDLQFLVIAFSETEKINIVAGSGNRPQLLNFIEQLKAHVYKIT